jgi:hypothetical protein
MVGLKINAKKTNSMYLNTERLPVIFVEWKQLDTAHPCFTPDFTRKLVSASELMVHEKFV